MKKVLFISYDFPPRRTSAVYRVAHLTRYLSRLGWLPTVLTIGGKPGQVEDPELLDKIPQEVQVIRTPLLRMNAWENPTARVARGAGGLQSRFDDARQSFGDRALRSLAEFIRSTLYFPDETVGWIPFGLAGAIKLLRRQAHDVIYTTSPPRAASVIGMLLKILMDVPWVLEFMDPWYPPSRLVRRGFEHWLLSSMLRRANAVVVMTDGHKEELSRSFKLSSAKLAVVRNGFDEEDFNFCAPPDKDFFPPGYIHLSHFGTVYSDSTGQFFPALSELVRECQDVKKRLRINVIGYPDKAILAYANDGELHEVIKLYPFVPHHKALQAMRASHCLLLFWGRPEFSRLAVAGKTYEYLRIGRPILAVTHKGGVKDLIERAEAGWVVDPDNKQAIKEALRRLLIDVESKQDSAPKRPDFVEQFRWDRLAEKLASVFDSVLSHGA